MWTQDNKYYICNCHQRILVNLALAIRHVITSTVSISNQPWSICLGHFENNAFEFYHKIQSSHSPYHLRIWSHIKNYYPSLKDCKFCKLKCAKWRIVRGWGLAKLPIEILQSIPTPNPNGDWSISGPIPKIIIRFHIWYFMIFDFLILIDY